MAEPLELAIDTASSVASVALTREGTLLAELTWDCGRDHSRQLLPAIDALLQRIGRSKDDLTAIFVCTGPGGYGGLRAGVSVAKGLAYALGQPLVGIGRLEVEAYAFAAFGLPVVAVHRAGRTELAWAVYVADPTWRELTPPRLSSVETLVRRLPDRAVVTGELDEALVRRLARRGHHVVQGAAAVRRAALLAELAQRRLAAGRTDDPKALVPLYLREPAIGPRK